MRKFLVSLIVLILCIISFIAGTAFNSINIANDSFQRFDEFIKMATDPELQIRRDIDLYKRSLKDTNEVSKALRFFILTKYDWDNRCVGEYCDELNMNSPTYESNQVIIEFLNKYPEAKCKDLAIKQRVECNLELVP
ncbi:hypothetical protein [Psychrosphaera algicola]|uniref:Uncharacterized protein n=1 Tax=Psychrosphaera algicola TaxID=3023714 RepID=A0ABT5FBR6_9GAMM|nr:hypothetical protein [Psychrosphaera sp. G1-22]MDC2888006.1 hypothetical protein [Psychrosphaera sp. G1-22]